MMKKNILAVLVAGMLIGGLSACGGSTENSSNNEQQPKSVSEAEKINLSDMTAEEIVNQFKDAGYPISKIIVYTEENDVNELLGRPNQYISKINFADSRKDQVDIENNPVGGSIEVFNNNEDAEARKKHVEDIIKATGMFNQYIYIENNVLLRIDGALTPEQAKEYEDGFHLMIDGKKPKFTGTIEEVEPKDSGMLGTCNVSIKDYKLIQNADGQDVIIINYDFTNTSSEATSFDTITYVKAFQDGIELESEYLYDNPDYDSNSRSKSIKDNATITVQNAFRLSNTNSPVEVEVKEFVSLDNNKLKKTFEIAQ